MLTGQHYDGRGWRSHPVSTSGRIGCLEEHASCVRNKPIVPCVAADGISLRRYDVDWERYTGKKNQPKQVSFATKEGTKAGRVVGVDQATGQLVVEVNDHTVAPVDPFLTTRPFTIEDLNRAEAKMLNGDVCGPIHFVDVEMNGSTWQIVNQGCGPDHVRITP